MIAYEAAILSALEEVENALVAYVEVQRQMQSLSEATQAARKAVELAQHKYQAGLTDFNNVLDAQRSLLSFQEQLAQSEGKRCLQPGPPVQGPWRRLEISLPGRRKIVFNGEEI